MVQLILKDNLDKITVAEFAGCMSGHSLSVLVLAGDATAEELEKCWYNLVTQYHDADGSVEMSEWVRKVAKASYLRYRIYTIQRTVDMIDRLVAMISLLPDKDDLYTELGPLIEILRFFDYKFPFTITSVLNDIAKVVTFEKKHVLELNRLEAALQPKGDSTEYISPDAYFSRQMAEIRKFEGYNTPHRQLAKTMYMSEYVECRARLRQYNEEVKNMNKDGQE